SLPAMTAHVPFLGVNDSGRVRLDYVSSGMTVYD
ncbi:MAG: hypothetical protein QOJ11_1261, partial [Frankiales bacterium]|nr:hypothetical protein [Frankiales bacterium]